MDGRPHRHGTVHWKTTKEGYGHHGKNDMSARALWRTYPNYLVVVSVCSARSRFCSHPAYLQWNLKQIDSARRIKDGSQLMLRGAPGGYPGSVSTALTILDLGSTQPDRATITTTTVPPHLRTLERKLLLTVVPNPLRDVTRGPAKQLAAPATAQRPRGAYVDRGSSHTPEGMGRPPRHRRSAWPMHDMRACGAPVGPTDAHHRWQGPSQPTKVAWGARRGGAEVWNGTRSTAQ